MHRIGSPRGATFPSDPFALPPCQVLSELQVLQRGLSARLRQAQGYRRELEALVGPAETRAQAALRGGTSAVKAPYSRARRD